MKKIVSSLLVLVLVFSMTIALADEGEFVFPENQEPVYTTQMFQQWFKIRADSPEEKAFLQDFAIYAGKGMLKHAIVTADQFYNHAEGGIQKSDDVIVAKTAYTIATGKLWKEDTIPEGVKFNLSFLGENEWCYEILNDSYIDKEYEANYKISGAGENQRHFITSAGWFFCLPGYQKTLEDGTIVYLVNELGQYYCEGELKEGIN